MVFVTVGFHVPFKRLLDKMDEIAPRLEDEVVLQKGNYAFEPRHCVSFSANPSLDEWLDRANLVISHGGYTVVELIRRKKQFIVFPRLKRYGEVCNDHQVEFCQALSERLRLDFPIILDENMLLDAITGFRSIGYGQMNETLPRLKNYLREYLDTLKC